MQSTKCLHKHNNQLCKNESVLKNSETSIKHIPKERQKSYLTIMTTFEFLLDKEVTFQIIPHKTERKISEDSKTVKWIYTRGISPVLH